MKNYEITLAAPGRTKKTPFNETVTTSAVLVETAVAKGARALVEKYIRTVKRRRPAAFTLTLRQLPNEPESVEAPAAE